MRNKSSVERRVLIVGGGIAGPALALCLAKQGIRSVVVEKDKAPRDGGYKVDVRGVALEVLDQLGLYADAKNANCNVEKVAIVNGELREVAAFDANYFFGRAPRDLEVMRGDLSRLLRERADTNVEFRFGERVTSWIEHDDDI
jgi:2-polyprenyl-6-methoxyphenol hydroxylase-like FAD-dependent oxidoreductase